MHDGLDTLPLGWLDDVASDGRGARWISPGELCVYDAEIGRALLKNDDGRLIDHSDFFGPIERALAPRAAQVALARACLGLVQQQVRTADFIAHVDALDRRSDWPKAGNALLLAIMRPILAAPRRSAAFQAALDGLVANRILSRHERARGKLRRAVDRFRFARALLKEMANARPAEPPDDILDVLLLREFRMGEETRIQLYAAFVFALVGSIGFALGWSLLLALRHGKAAQPAPHIVREALRLFPVAWLLERRVRAEQEILGERLCPGDRILISPYAIHQNPAYWAAPRDFRPERWHGKVERGAWMPFGAGGQSCIAASLSIEVASALLERLLQRAVRIEGGEGPPSMGAALAPPRFTLVADR